MPGVLTYEEAEVAGAGGQEVVHHGLPHRHPGVQQHREVSQLVGELLAEDGQRHGHPRQDGLREGGAYREPVNEVMNSIAEYDHPGHGGNLVAGVLTERPDVLHGWSGGWVRSGLVTEGSSDS